MNPALMNYLQNNQMTGAQAARPGQDAYNPFDAGIQKAISSARTSLGMTKQQEDSALRNSMLTFADNMAQQPREKGFFNNFASAGRALSPAIRAYDDAENTAITENNALANQILAYKAAEQQRLAQMEDSLWRRQHAERQFGEQQRYHDMMNERMSSKGENRKTEALMNEDPSSSELSSLLNNAETLLMEDLDKQETYRGRFSNLLSGMTPGGYIPTKQQAQVNAMGDVLRGKLFNAWGYRNKEEFKHVPSISADNPPEVNLEIIRTLKNLLGEANPMEEGQFQGQQNLDLGIPIQEQDNMQSILMQDANGGQYMIPANEVEGALSDGLVLIEGR